MKTNQPGQEAPMDTTEYECADISSSERAELALKIRAYCAYQRADPALYIFTTFPEFTRDEMDVICVDRKLYDQMWGGDHV